METSPTRRPLQGLNGHFISSPGQAWQIQHSADEQLLGSGSSDQQRHAEGLWIGSARTGIVCIASFPPRPTSKHYLYLALPLSHLCKALCGGWTEVSASGSPPTPLLQHRGWVRWFLVSTVTLPGWPHDYKRSRQGWLSSVVCGQHVLDGGLLPRATTGVMPPWGVPAWRYSSSTGQGRTSVQGGSRTHDHSEATICMTAVFLDNVNP